jgi:hypothetical protein
VVVLGEIAHIVAESPSGPRGDSPMTAEERNRYENLILLCNQHHQLIDSKEALAKYTVERLKAMKQAHEEWVQRSLRGRTNTPVELPEMVRDTVYSNVLPVAQMPRYVYGAPCDGNERAIKPATTSNGTMMPFIRRSGWVWAFQDLRSDTGPFRDFVNCHEAERFLAEEWWEDPDREAWYVELLNRSLNKLTGRLGLRLDASHGRRYYFEPESGGVERRITYQPPNAAKATRSVVWQPKQKSTGEPRNYWYHNAVNLRFFLAGAAHWYLSIRPELRITTDGYESIEAKQVGRRVTRKKSRLFNFDLLGEVQFWRDFLSKNSSRIVLPFGSGTQTLVVSNSLSSGQISWPGIPVEHDMPFRNVEYIDDLFSWGEATGMFDDATDSGESGWDEVELDDEDVRR